MAAPAGALTSGPGAAPPHAVETGLADERLMPFGETDAELAALVAEDAADLHARWVRLAFMWKEFEPRQGHFSEAHLARVDRVVDALHAANVKVIMTVTGVPKWASSKAFWDHPMPGARPGYQPYYPMRKATLEDFAALGELLARRYAGRVDILECWNEPNLWAFLYPQRTKGRKDFGAWTYLRMLTAFTTGVRRAGTGIRVAAGATSCSGDNDRMRTSPQSFARYLRSHGAGLWFDVYSHHPYTPGFSANTAPEQAPDHPEHTVTLGNLSTLLQVFPDKPFFLSEFGYSTRPSIAMGWFAVSEAVQADYLTRAYAVASRYPQVEALVWFLLRDHRPGGKPADWGIYSGLRRLNDSRKPSWYAFAALGGGGDPLPVEGQPTAPR